MVGAASAGTAAGRGGAGLAARRRRAITWLRRNQLSLFGSVAVVVAWDITARLIDYPYMPPILDVVVALERLLVDGTIARAVKTSLTALAYGITFAILGGTLIGASMGLFTTVRHALNIYVDALMSAPMTAFVPLFIILFGLGIETRIVVVTLFALFPIVINTQAGMLAADPELIKMARSFGAKPLEIFFKIRLPMSYDHLQAGLRLGMARAVDGNITAEVLIAAVGLGGLVTIYGRAFSADRLFAVVVVIVIMSFTVVGITRLAGRLALGLHK